MSQTAYTAMIEYQECKDFSNKLEKLINIVENNAEEKDDTVTLSLSRDDYYSIKAALNKSNVIVCSYRDTIAKTMACTRMPDTLA